MHLKFTKMNGIGNDFVVIDTINQHINITKNMVKRIADRHRGVGCDQLLIIEPPKEGHVDFNYRIFNRDGLEASQCGNGARCIAKFIYDQGLSGKRRLLVSSIGGMLHIELVGKNMVAVEIQPPSFDPKKVPFKTEKQEKSYKLEIMSRMIEFVPVTVGNPHAIIFERDIRKVNIRQIGRDFQKHQSFPNQVNVNFAQIINKDLIKLRVFERGSGETESCGSGACATAAVAIRDGLVNSSVTVQQKGGHLKIVWPNESDRIKMIGEAKTVFQGIMNI